MKTGGITLVKGDLRGIVKALRLSQRTMSNIRQNLFFAFFYNALGVPLAAEFCTLLRIAVEPDDRCCRDELQFRVRDCQCTQVEDCENSKQIT